jgi:hypothetical protein
MSQFQRSTDDYAHSLIGKSLPDFSRMNFYTGGSKQHGEINRGKGRASKTGYV